MEGNGLTVDEQHDLSPSTSVALRMLYMLLGGGDSDQAGLQGPFDDFVRWIQRQQFAKLLLECVQVEHVVQMARTSWKVSSSAHHAH